MKGVIRDLAQAWVMLIVVFLVLTHFTGFERGVRAIARGLIGSTEALQGRSKPTAY